MERNIGAKFVGAFVVGGCIAVCMQVIMALLGMILPVHELTTPLSLVALGIAGAVLVLTGNYQKLNEIGGFGAGIMFCGLVDAVASIYMGSTMKSGGNKSAGIKAVGKFVLFNLGSFVVTGIVLGLLLARTPGVLASMAPAGAGPGPIIFLYAFLMGGLISIEGQALIEFTPLPLPIIIFINAAIGMALAIFGVSTQLEVLTGAGFCATIVDAGAAAVLGGATIVLAGTPLRVIILLLVIAIVVAMGVICGNILVNRRIKK